MPPRPSASSWKRSAPSPSSIIWRAPATPCTSWDVATYRCGRDAEALDCLSQALASYRATGNRRRQAATLRSLGTAQSRVGLAAEARESLAQAAVIFTELGDSAQAEEVGAEQAESGIS